MYYNYVLQSKKDGKWYTGATKNLRKRFEEHNNNLVRSTKGRGPFFTLYYEACVNKYDALAREKYLKSGMGKRYLKNRLKRFLFLTGQVHPVRGKLPKAAVSSNGGYIALISVIIISLLLLTISTALSFSGFMSRFNVLNSEFKEVSNGLAEACADRAILELAQDWNYSGGQIVKVGARQCEIISVEASGVNENTIKTQASTTVLANKFSFTNLVVKVSTSTDDIQVLSWKEVVNF